MPAKYTAKDIGEIVRKTRKNLAVTQRTLALTSGTGLRFIIDLEHGKPTCELQKVLTVLHTLGIRLELDPPLKRKDVSHAMQARRFWPREFLQHPNQESPPGRLCTHLATGNRTGDSVFLTENRTKASLLGVPEREGDQAGVCQCR